MPTGAAWWTGAQALPRLVLVALALALNPAQAEEAPEGGSAIIGLEITPRVERAVTKGCAWLAKNQNRDGSEKSNYSVAATALAGLAWLGAGSTPQEGPYAQNIRRALDFIVSCQGSSGFITEGGRGAGDSSMYGHGFATQFLAQAYGMLRGDEQRSEKVLRALRRGAGLIEATQNQFGGWNGAPDARATDDGSGAVAIMQVSALRAAQSCGIEIREAKVEKAKKYLLDMTNNSGWYAYNWSARGEGQHSAGTTAAGMYMLGALNLFSNPKYERGIKNIMDTAPFLPGRRNQEGQWYWYYYCCFYASLAIFQHGGKEWTKWYPAMVNDMLKRQKGDGSFEDEYGGVYTAMGLLCLELPYRYLPLFQEGGPGREGR